MGDELEMDEVTSAHAAVRTVAHVAVHVGTARALVEEAEL